ncbi:ABC transporter permease, partial [Dactylosporangium sp. NPDC000555]
MSGGLGRVVRSGVGRRRVQTVVMTLTTLLAVTASVLAVGLLVASSAPFARAFSRQHGAHLAAQFDAGKVTAEQLSATAHAAGVTAAAGPFPT